MGSVDGISHENDVVVMPLLAFDGGELEPFGVVAHKRMTFKMLSEHLLAPFQGVIVTDSGQENVVLGPVEPETSPGLWRHLHDDRASLIRVGVDVSPDHPGRRVFEDEVELVEYLGCAKPHVLVDALTDRRPEVLSERLAHHRVGTVGTHHQIRLRE